MVMLELLLSIRYLSVDCQCIKLSLQRILINTTLRYYCLRLVPALGRNSKSYPGGVPAGIGSIYPGGIPGGIKSWSRRDSRWDEVEIRRFCIQMNYHFPSDLSIFQLPSNLKPLRWRTLWQSPMQFQRKVRPG